MRDDNNRLYVILIGSSLLFLLGFLVIWNVDNYDTEKQNLERQLSQQMTLACSAYRDSIVQNIIKILKISSDTIAGSHRLPQMQDNIVDSTYLQTLILGTDMGSLDGDLSISVKVSDTLQDQSIYREELMINMNDEIVAWRSDSDRITFQISEDSLESQYERDTIMYLPRLKRSAMQYNIGIPQVYRDIDALFRANLLISALPSEHMITYLDSVSADSDDIIINFEYESFNMSNQSIPIALFSNYSRHLFGKIITPLISSLLLFALVGMSFYFIISKWKEQEKMTKIRRAFMSNMTHELKTPLATVGIALEALDNYDVLDDRVKSKEYIDISRKELGRLGLLVDKVLKMTTHENGIGELFVEVINLNELMNEILNTMKVHFESTNTLITYHTTEEPIMLHGDKIHLINSIYNLIDNAIKYSKDRPKIKISVICELTYVTLTIQDHGIGIPRAYQDKVFDRLFRVPNDDIHDTKGYGLGLNYVKQIVKLHKGKIKLTSTEGLGTSITVQIPVHQ